MARNDYVVAPKPLFNKANKANLVLPDIPYQALAAKAFDIREELIAYDFTIDDHDPISVTLEQQIEVFDGFLDNPLEPKIYVIGSKFKDTKALQLAAQMCLYWQMTCTVHTIGDWDTPPSMQKRITKGCEWFPIYSNWDHVSSKVKNPFHSSAFPVFHNITEHSDNKMVDKLRDALTAWAKYPRLLVYSGLMNPEEWVMRRLHVEASTIWLGNSVLRQEDV